MNKVTLLLAAALVLPTAALAQSAPPAPVTTAAPAAPAANRTWDSAQMQAEMAKMQAGMAKMEAAHKAARTKILAALTPAHKAYFANLVGQLAVAANPDPKAAVAKLDGILTASEKSKIIAVQTDLMKSMMAAHHGMTFNNVRVIKDADGTSQTTEMAGGAGPMGPGHVGHAHKHRAPDAGRILFEMSGPGDGMHPPMMMMRVERFGHGGHGPHGAPLPGPVTPAPAPTPSS
jgi:hypothetical protein